MRRVAIATIGRWYLLSNYGSFYQHYALRHVLKKCGLNCFRVRSSSETCSLRASLADFIKDVFRPLYWIIKKKPDRKILLSLHKDAIQHEKRFLRDFRSLIAPSEEPQRFDQETVGVKGGDQVLYPSEDVLWLTDIPKTNPRICYAASCDWRWLSGSAEGQKILTSRLSDFSAIGVRESRGVEMISKMLGGKRRVARVADPVFLLSHKEWRNVESNRKAFCRSTLLCYLVNVRCETDLKYDQLAALAVELGCDLRIIGIQGTCRFVPRNVLFDPGPREFLRAMDEARYFITNSFHGLAFALIYQKQFIFLPQINMPGRNQNERQVELLGRYGLMNRLCSEDGTVCQKCSRLQEEIDWDSVSKTTLYEKEFSFGWLKDSLCLR